MKPTIVSVFKNVGIVIAVILGCIQLWDWITAPRDRLVAAIEYGPLMLPPSIEAEFVRLRDLADEDKLKEMIRFDELLSYPETEPRGYIGDRVVAAVAMVLRINLPYYGLPPNYGRLNGYWTAKIVNRSEKALAEVKLSLPHTQYVKIKREGQGAIHSATNDVIHLGKMQPQDEAWIVAWTSIEPSRYYADDIKLTHDAGMGEIDVRAPVGRIGQWFDRFWSLLAFLLLMAVFWTVLILADIRSSIRSNRATTPRLDADTSEKGGS